VAAAIAGSNVIIKVSIMLTVVGEWIEDRSLAPELVEFLEFVSAVGIHNREIIGLSLQVALNVRPRFGPKQNGLRRHLSSGLTNGHLDGWFPYSNIDSGGLACRVRLGSKGDIVGAFGRVRFTPESGHPTNEWACRPSAKADITTSPNDDLATAADLA